MELLVYSNNTAIPELMGYRLIDDKTQNILHLLNKTGAKLGAEEELAFLFALFLLVGVSSRARRRRQDCCLDSK